MFTNMFAHFLIKVILFLTVNLALSGYSSHRIIVNPVEILKKDIDKDNDNDMSILYIYRS